MQEELASVDEGRRISTTQHLERSPTTRTALHRYSEFPDELKLVFLKAALVSDTAVVDMHHRYAYNSRAVCLPALLQVDKLHRNVGGSYFFKENTFLFTNPGTIEKFVDRFPEAAARIEKVVLQMNIQQLSGDSVRSLTQGLSNPTGPWFSNVIGKPSIICSERMTTICGNSVAGCFKGIKQLTLDIQGWKQMEEFEVLPTPGSQGVQGTAVSYSANVIIDQKAADGKRRNTTHQMVSKAAVQRPRHEERVTKPVRVVQNANIGGWAKRLIEGGWGAPIVRITGAEDYPYQEQVSGLEIVLQGGV